MTRLTTRTVRAIFTLALLLNLNLCTLQASDKPARILFVTQSAGFVHVLSVVTNRWLFVNV